MERKSDSLLFRIGVILFSFTIVSLILCGLATYFSQMNSYQEQCEIKIRGIGEYLSSLMSADGDDFVEYQKYYINHCQDADIPIDFEGYEEAREDFETLFASRYPGRTLGSDLTISAMDPDVQMAWFIYRHEYWLWTFEQAREDFDIPYTYYLLPDDTTYNVTYMIDGERIPREDDPDLIYLGATYYDDPEKVPVQWAAWQRDVPPEGYQVWNNEWGHTYAYYTPLYINGQKLGLIGTEINVATVNRGILKGTVIQLVCVGIVLVLAVIGMLLMIHRKYIKKIESLQQSMKEFASHKNFSIAADIERTSTGHDEISSLANETAAMILELDHYMKNLLETSKELSEAKERADQMSKMTTKDVLTGIRNKSAYDEEAKRLDWEIAEKTAEFGIALVDLNYLKRINETYGHEKGNRALKRLCEIVCDIFAHCPVFRISGDEFVVILKGKDLENQEALFAQLYETLLATQNDEKLQPWEKLSASVGVGIFDPETDQSVSNVFKRADNNLYERKKELNALQ